MTRGFAKRFSRGVCALALLAGLGLARSAAAQWVDYPTADVPRNADGTPNLKAPAPRTREGTPASSSACSASDAARKLTSLRFGAMRGRAVN